MLEPIVPPGASASSEDANCDSDEDEKPTQKSLRASSITAGYITSPPTIVMSTSRTSDIFEVVMLITRRHARFFLSVRNLHTSLPAVHRSPSNQVVDSSRSSPVSSVGLAVPPVGGCEAAGGADVFATDTSDSVKLTGEIPGTPVNESTPTFEVL